MKSALHLEAPRQSGERQFALRGFAARQEGAAPASLLISVVVPTRARPDLLRRCLAALLAQDLDPAAYEIVVADQAPTVGMRRMVEGMAEAARVAAPPAAGAAGAAPVWAERRAGELLVDGVGFTQRALPADLPVERAPSIRYVPLAQARGAAAARNAGWRSARGQIIAFTDDDCLPASDWLRAGLGAFDEHVIGVMGRVVVASPGGSAEHQHRADRLAAGEFVAANCFYRREALAAVGGFDERFADECYEDTDLFFTLLRRGGKFVAAPAATVTHQAQPRAWGSSLREQHRRMYEALLYRKHPELYQRRVCSEPPWRDYAAVVALLLAIAGLLLAAHALALCAGAAWGLLTVWLSARRLSGGAPAPGRIAATLAASALLPPLAIFWRLRGALRYRVFFF